MLSVSLAMQCAETQMCTVSFSLPLSLALAQQITVHCIDYWTTVRRIHQLKMTQMQGVVYWTTSRSDHEKEHM